MERRRDGQALMEYAVLIDLVVAALVGMQVYTKRGIQAGIKEAADQIGDQQGGMKYESGERRNRTVAAGTVLDRRSSTTAESGRTNRDVQGAGGGLTRTIAEQTSTAGALGGGISTRSVVVVEPDD